MFSPDEIKKYKATARDLGFLMLDIKELGKLQEHLEAADLISLYFLMDLAHSCEVSASYSSAKTTFNMMGDAARSVLLAKLAKELTDLRKRVDELEFKVRV